jgi:hypothetical protein
MSGSGAPVFSKFPGEYEIAPSVMFSLVRTGKA